MKSKGCTFPWANSREVEEHVKKRFDRAVCSFEWRIIYLEAEAFALQVTGYDHNLIMLKRMDETWC